MNRTVIATAAAGLAVAWAVVLGTSATDQEPAPKAAPARALTNATPAEPPGDGLPTLTVPAELPLREVAAWLSNQAMTRQIARAKAAAERAEAERLRRGDPPPNPTSGGRCGPMLVTPLAPVLSLAEWGHLRDRCIEEIKAGGPESGDAVMVLVHSVRAAATERGYASVYSPVIEEAFRFAAESPTSTVRTAAVHALSMGLTAPADIDGDLQRALDACASDDKALRSSGASLLGSLTSRRTQGENTLGRDPERAIARLRELWGSPDGLVRLVSIHASGCGGKASVAVLDELVKMLDAKDRMTRAGAQNAIGEMGPNAFGAIPAIIQRLSHRSSEERTRAALLLQRLRPGPMAAPAVPGLIAILKDADGNARTVAAAVLREMGAAGEPAVETLRKLAQGDDPFAKHFIEAADRIEAAVRDQAERTR
jgi:HEAT repeat protein